MACPFCGEEFNDNVYDAMRSAEDSICCPNCGIRIYNNQFYIPESMAYSY